MKDIIGTGFMKKHRSGWKKAIQLAFNLATESARKKELQDADFLQIHQLRRLLISLKLYFQFYTAFVKIDSDGDKTLEYSEFKKAVKIVMQWGVSITNVKSTFKSIDVDRSGKIDFEEFC